MHHHALAVHRGVRAVALDDEADRRLRVAVARAISPGRMSCRPAYSVCVIDDAPRSAGFSKTSTRRTASRAR
jgi:hypothetical protein